MADNHPIDQWVNNTLRGYEADFRQEDWTAMEQMLDQKKRGVAPIWYWMGAAAVVAGLLIGFGPLWLTNPAPESYALQSSQPLPQLHLPTASSQTSGAMGSTAATAAIATAHIAKEPSTTEQAAGKGRTTEQAGDGAANPPSLLAQGSAEDMAGSLTTTSALHPLSTRGMDALVEAKGTPAITGFYDTIPNPFTQEQRYIQPYIGLSGLAGITRKNTVKFTHAQGVSAGIQLWNGVSLEAGLGLHQLQYAEKGTGLVSQYGRHIRTTARLQYWEVPILVGWSWTTPSQNWSVDAKAGIRQLIPLQATYTYTYEKAPVATTGSAVPAYQATTNITVAMDNNMQERAVFNTDFTGGGNGVTPAASHPPVTLAYASAGLTRHMNNGMAIAGGLYYQNALSPVGWHATDLQGIGLHLGLKYML